MRLLPSLFACWMGALDVFGADRCAGACLGDDGVVMAVCGEEEVKDAVDASGGCFASRSPALLG